MMKLFLLLLFINLSQVFAQDEEYPARNPELDSEYSPHGNILVPREEQELLSEDLNDTQAPEEVYEAEEEYLE